MLEFPANPLRAPRRARIQGRAGDWSVARPTGALVMAPLPTHTHVERYYWAGWAELPATVEVWGQAEFVDQYAAGGATFAASRGVPTLRLRPDGAACGW